MGCAGKSLTVGVVGDNIGEKSKTIEKKPIFNIARGGRRKGKKIFNRL